MINKAGATLSLLILGSTLCAAGDRTVEISGVAIRVYESGAGPAVVFESGVGEDVGTWRDVQPAVEQFAHTFSYDRPGIGLSQPSRLPRTVPQMAADLHSVLHAAKLAPPYVLVGHSLGGTIVQVFAHDYPNEVGGLVLVDPEDGRLLDMLHARMSASDWAARQKALDEAMPNIPATVRAELAAANNSGEAAAQATPLPKVPIVLLTGTKKNPEFPGNPLEQDLKRQLHEALLATLPGATHVLVPGSRHYIQNDAPELVIHAIRDVTRADRQH